MSDGVAAGALRTQVLVLGAGPAGSACAIALARAGLRVLLADRHDFPRDKVCGDALIPDAHRALARLGLLGAVLSRARRLGRVDCVGPLGGRVALPAALAVLPRRQLDDLLRQAALAAGARWLAQARFEVPLLDAGGARVQGARLRRADGTALDVHAHWTVLATGADAGALQAAGLLTRRAPSSMAVRAYVRCDAAAGVDLADATAATDPGDAGQALEVVWHRALKGGYGWIFPCGDGLFNVGVGITQAARMGTSGDAARGPNLRQLFDTFTQVHAPARQLLARGAQVADLKGAPLRCSLQGARWSRPGLLAAGEAIGTTYLLSGEGIGKALETGMAAAQAIQEGAGGDDARVLARHAAQLQALVPRYAAYERANRINEHPFIAEWLIRRAGAREGLRQRLAGVLDERDDPAALVGWRALLGLALPF